METNKIIKVRDIELERREAEGEVSYRKFASRIVGNEQEAKEILAVAIKLALEEDPAAVNEKYGLSVVLTDTYEATSYTMVARVGTDDAETEEFMLEEYPELIEVLDNGVKILFGSGFSGLPGEKDFED